MPIPREYILGDNVLFSIYYQKFKTQRLALWSLRLIMVLCLMLATLEVWVNDRPIVVHHQNSWFFPLWKTYSESDFQLSDSNITVNYLAEDWQVMIQKADSFVLWPLIPFSYRTIDYHLNMPAPAEPSRTHWLGTDTFGRDLLALTLYSLRFSLIFGLTLAVLSAGFGILVGALQGYRGGLTDLIGQRFLEVWGGLPQLFILIILAGIIYPSFWSLLFILLLFSWTELVPLVRAECLKTRQMDYVRAARALGVKDIRIMLRHVLPNAMVATLTFLPFLLTSSMVVLASLDFLGLGLPLGYPSLGEILRQGKDNTQAPWIGITGFLFTGIVLSLLMFINEGVRHALDPRRR